MVEGRAFHFLQHISQISKLLLTHVGTFKDHSLSNMFISSELIIGFQLLHTQNLCLSDFPESPKRNVFPGRPTKTRLCHWRVPLWRHQVSCPVPQGPRLLPECEHLSHPHREHCEPVLTIQVIQLPMHPMPPQYRRTFLPIRRCP